jgi:polysaccharide pyruvyl transferase WcaK-like protein
MPLQTLEPGPAGDDRPKRKSFVLLFANFGGNLGDLAILECTIAWLNATFAGCRVLVSPLSDRRSPALQAQLKSRYENVSMLEAFGPSLPQFPSLQRKWPFANERILAPIFLRFLINRARRSSLAVAFRSADAVLGVGGGHWSGFDKPMNMLALFRVASELCKTVVLLPQSLPEAISPGVKRLMPAALGNVAAIYLRDPTSLQAARDAQLPRTRLLPDTVLLSDPPQLGRERPGHPPTVAICLRWNTARLREDGWTDLEKAAQMIRSRGARLLTFTTHASEDASITRRWTSMPGLDHVPVDSIDNVLSVLASADIVISDRLHALIWATVVGTPIVPVLSLPKVRGYARYLRTPIAVAHFGELSWDAHIDPILADWKAHRGALLSFAASARQELTTVLSAELQKHLG